MRKVHAAIILGSSAGTSVGIGGRGGGESIGRAEGRPSILRVTLQGFTSHLVAHKGISSNGLQGLRANKVFRLGVEIRSPHPLK